MCEPYDSSSHNKSILVHNQLLLNTTLEEKRGLRLRSWIFEAARELLPYTYLQLHPIPLNGHKKGE